MIAAWLIVCSILLLLGFAGVSAAIIAEWPTLPTGRRIVCILAAAALLLLAGALLRKAIVDRKDEVRRKVEQCLAEGGIPDRSGHYGMNVHCYQTGEGMTP